MRFILISNKKVGMLVSLFALCLGLLMVCLASPGQAEPPPPSAALLQASEGLDRYQIEAVFEPDSATLACVQRVWYTNRSDQRLNNLYFHVYANAFKREQTAPPAVDELAEKTYPRGFDPGEIAFDSVRVNGEGAAFAVQGEDEAVLRVPVGLLAPGQEVALEFVYTLRVPLCNYRFGQGDGGVWTLGNSFPIAAVMEEGIWRLDPYVPIGDPFFSTCADYKVTIDAPSGYEVAASGALRGKDTANGRTRWRFELPAARDFALTFSDGYEVARTSVDGIEVLSYGSTQRRAQDALDIAADVLDTLGDLFAPYPYPSFTVAEVDLGGYGGMEYPGLVMIEDTLYGPGGTLEYVVAHETAHQWWYGQVGNDEVREPWLDEALSEYSTLLYFERRYGPERYAEWVELSLEPALRLSLPGVSIATGIEGFSSLPEYSMVVYQRGAAMFHGLREALGEDAFLRVLRAYLEEYRYDIATRADLIRVFNQTTGSNWQGFFDDYLDGGF